MSRHGIIDVGSNAIRMLLVEQGPDGDRELARERDPVRLGAGVFRDGHIEAAAMEQAAASFARFAALCAANRVDSITAIATAATREARNQGEFRERVRAASGIRLQIIDGQAEALLLRDTMAAHLDLEGSPTLLLDLGAGSVEVVFIAEGQVEAASHPLGSLRMLAEVLPAGAPDHGPDFLARLEALVVATVPQVPRAERFAVCGGSLDRLVRLMEGRGEVGESHGLPALAMSALQERTEDLARLTRQQRIERHGLEADRADTIVPAAAVTLNLGRRAGTEEVLVPRIDLKDGIAWRLRQGRAPI